jgi:anaerobic selenocysteine-containing dehydrogenase
MIYKKIINVMREIDFIPKETFVKMKSGGYTAVSHDTVARILHPILAKEGIVVRVTLLDSTKETYKDDMVFYSGKYSLSLIDADDGDYIEYVGEAHAIDVGDKAPGKALSYATKMMLLKAFLLETGENDEERAEEAEMISEEDAEDIRELAEKTGTNINSILSWAGIKSLTELRKDQYSRVIDILEKKLKRGQ